MTLVQVARVKKTFLEAFRQNGNITKSAEIAKVSRNTPANWRDSDPEFAEQYSIAELEAIDSLEAEARRRAVEGVQKPIYHNGKMVDVVREYSDTLLIFLLKGARPDKYRDQAQTQVNIDNRSVQITYEDRRIADRNP
jgi:hypothetical protein